MVYFVHLLLFIIIYFGYFFPVWEKQTRTLLILHIIMFNYLVIVLSLTVVPLAIPSSLAHLNINLVQAINFIPFRDVMNGYAFAKREVLLNIIMMIPFGILIPLLTKKKWLATTVATCLLSVTIELTQLFTILFQMENVRIVDVTDVITNTFGGMCGYFLLYIFNKVKQKIP